MRKEEKKEALNAFVESLKNKTADELRAIEQEVIAEADAYDEELKNKEFKLPKEGFDTVGDSIQYFLNKQTVQWNYTLGCIAMYDFWNEYHKTISYAMLDSVLRTLGGLQFTGIDEWRAVVKINDYFEAVREDYAATTDKIYEIADKHSAVMDALKLFEPVTTNE